MNGMTLPYPTMQWGQSNDAPVRKARLVKPTDFFGELVNDAWKYMGKNPLSKKQVMSYERFYEAHASDMADILGAFTAEELTAIAIGRGHNLGPAYAEAEAKYWAIWDAWKPADVPKGHRWMKGITAYELALAEREVEGKTVHSTDGVEDPNA